MPAPDPRLLFHQAIGSFLQSSSAYLSPLHRIVAVPYCSLRRCHSINFRVLILEVVILLS